MGDTVFGNKHGGDNVAGHKYVIRGATPTVAAVPRRVILVLSANADGQSPLRIDQERRAIDLAVEHSPEGSRLEVRTADAVRLDDLHRALLRHRPVIAHFSGHGHPNEGIQVVDVSGRARSVPPRALRDLFRVLGAGIRCVVLNACHTHEQAAAIAAHVPCVVGMRHQVLDDTAVLFAAGFYRGIANGKSVRASFELARNGLDLHGIPDIDVPQMIGLAGDAERPIIELV